MLPCRCLDQRGVSSLPFTLSMPRWQTVSTVGINQIKRLAFFQPHVLSQGSQLECTFGADGMVVCSLAVLNSFL